MLDNKPVPRVAVAVIATHKNKVLFGKRRITGNDFVWQLPGGWINMGEAPAEAAVREVREETGLVLGTIRLVALTNNVFSSENHSISLCFEAECEKPEQLELKEPEKCLGWEWRRWQEVEEKLFLPLANLKKSNYRPFIVEKSKGNFSFY